MTENFYSILTKIGKDKMAQSQVDGDPVRVTEMAVGDSSGSYYEPDESQTSLQNENWRDDVNVIKIDESNSNWVVIEAVIPAEVGGFTVREVGLFDEDGDMIAIGKYPKTYKPNLDEGSAKDLYIRMIIEVSNASSISIVIDPSAVTATKKYVDDSIDNHGKEEMPHMIKNEDDGKLYRYGYRFINGKTQMIYEEVTN